MREGKRQRGRTLLLILARAVIYYLLFTRKELTTAVAHQAIPPSKPANEVWCGAATSTETEGGGVGSWSPGKDSSH